ncbi:MAG: hypothetical protein M3O87_02500, partial [Candidatus Dormibacteraeota bacterium]|nr:hypothetical protein [Candidatus Dormibacteraeota bacterium]
MGRNLLHAQRRRWLAGALIGGLAALAPGVANPAAATASLEVVGRSPLNSRGMNAAVAVAGSCAYVGSRSDAATLVVDVSNPASPQVAGELPRHPGSTPRELRAIPASQELVVLSYAINGGPNRLDFYRWSADCRHPTPAGGVDFGARAPHEFYLWQDPGRPSRVLLYVSMFGASGDGLEVIDITDVAHPARLGGWTVPSDYGHAPLHSIDVSADGSTAFVSLWTGGLVVADVADFAAGKPSPTLRPLTAPGGVFKTSPGDVHSAVPVPGRTMVVTTDERYPDQGCPFGTAHVVEVSTPAGPRAVSTMEVPENTPATCARAPSGTWSSHNSTVTRHLALITWHSAGLQVFGLDDPAQPVRLAELRPTGTAPLLRDLELGTTDTMTWSYPVISGGLVVVTDINQGLLLLRYHGPHEDEVSGTAFLEGNSNITGASSPAPDGSASAPSTP